jgi:hypothetical protein
MATQIGSQYYVDLAFNDTEFSATPTSVPRIFEMNNNHHHLPSVLLYVNDVTGSLLNQQNLGDGSPIDIATTSDPSLYPPVTTTYRMVGRPKAISSQTANLSITGYLDAPKYLRQVIQKSYRGNSSDVITQMAGDVGMTARTDPTNDSMAWLPNLKTYSNFARHLTDYGWASATSLMSMAVNRTKEILYFDMIDHIQNQPVATFYYGGTPPTGGGNSYLIARYNILTKSGVLNHWMGYGANTNQVGRDGTLNVYNPVQATFFSTFIDVATAVQSDINKLVRTAYHPPDTGNGHANFISAYHQNRRLRSLFSSDLEIMIIGDCTCDIFDIVAVDIVDSSTYQTNPAYQGNYVITAKTRTIWNNMYYTRLQLSTQGTEISGLITEW